MSRFRRRLMGLAAMKRAFADDFVRCEYIENTSTAYILPNYKTNANTIIELDVQITTVDVQARIIGNASGYFESYINGSSRFAFTSNGLLYSSGISANTLRHIIKLDNTILRGYIDDTEVKITKNASKYYNTMYLIARGNSNNLKCKIYGCKIYDGETMVRDFIPMYQISTDTYGLWDNVSESFFTSPNKVKFKGSLLFIDDYLKGMCSSYADSEGRIDYVTLANSPFGEYKTKLVNKLKWVDLTSSFNKDVKIYGVKSVNTQRLADCTVRFYINGTTNHIGLYIFYKRWGYYNNNSAYSGIANIWTNYDGFYYTIYLDTRSEERNIQYLTFYTINGYRPSQYQNTMVDVLVNSDDI